MCRVQLAGLLGGRSRPFLGECRFFLARIALHGQPDRAVAPELRCGGAKPILGHLAQLGSPQKVDLGGRSDSLEVAKSDGLGRPEVIFESWGSREGIITLHA